MKNTWKLPLIYQKEDREDQYVAGARASRVELEDCIQHNHDIFHQLNQKHELANSHPFGQHTLIFLPSIKYFASEEQAAYWLPLAQRCEILGTYVQTEIGHGTFVNGVETTATYERESQEFIFHSPTAASTKCWPGSLAFSVTHGVTMARLIIDNKDHGPHHFMVQYRSLVDFKPLPGIELGDIGTKMVRLRVGKSKTDYLMDE